MCLEEVYPEHDFDIVQSFDRKKGEGFYEDENGTKFKVRDMLYDNTYHFGCTDEYLSGILKKEDFFQKAKELVEGEYHQKFTYNETYLSNDISLDDNNITTDVVNYYTTPAHGVVQCWMEQNGNGTGIVFYFSDKDLDHSTIKARVDELYKKVQDLQKED